MNRDWKRVVFSFEFGDDADQPCPQCAEFDGCCDCPGPNSEAEDGTPFEFKEVHGVMFARPPRGYDWSGERILDGT